MPPVELHDVVTGILSVILFIGLPLLLALAARPGSDLDLSEDDHEQR